MRKLSDKFIGKGKYKYVMRRMIEIIDLAKTKFHQFEMERRRGQHRIRRNYEWAQIEINHEMTML